MPAEPEPARRDRRPDRRQVAQPIERRAPSDGDRLAAAPDEVVGEARVGERRHRLRDDPGPTRGPDPERLEQHPDDRLGGLVRGATRRPATAARVTGPGPTAGARRPRARARASRVTIRRPSPMSSKPLAASRATRSSGLVVRRRRPDVRLAADRREQDADLARAVDRTRRSRSASRSPRPGSRTARVEPGRAGAARRRGRAARGPGSAWTSASWRSRRRTVAASIGCHARGPYETGAGRGNVDIDEPQRRIERATWRRTAMSRTMTLSAVSGDPAPCSRPARGGGTATSRADDRPPRARHRRSERRQPLGGGRSRARRPTRAGTVRPSRWPGSRSRLRRSRPRSAT